MPCTGPVQQEALAQTLRQRTASEYRKTRRWRSPPCGHSARAREPRRGLIKIKKRRPSARRRSNRPTGQCPKTRRGPQGNLPRGPLPAHAAHAAPGARAHIEKRPPRTRRPALPQLRAAVLSAKAGLTAGFGMGPGDPRLCGRARGGRSPAAQVFEPARNPFSGATLAAAWRARTEDGASRSVLSIEDAKSSGH